MYLLKLAAQEWIIFFCIKKGSSNALSGVLVVCFFLEAAISMHLDYEQNHFNFWQEEIRNQLPTFRCTKVAASRRAL